MLESHPSNCSRAQLAMQAQTRSHVDFRRWDIGKDGSSTWPTSSLLTFVTTPLLSNSFVKVVPPHDWIIYSKTCPRSLTPRNAVWPFGPRPHVAPMASRPITSPNVLRRLLVFLVL